jgi:hypothetical protein
VRDRGAVLGLVVAAAVGVAAVVGLVVDVSVSMSSSRGLAVVRGGDARLLDAVYLAVAVIAGVAIVAMRRRAARQ